MRTPKRAAPGPDTRTQRLADARRLLREQRLAEAEALLRELTGTAPQDADAWHLRGLVQFRGGKHDAALSYWHRAIEADPRHCDAHFNIGNYHRARHRHADALAAFRAVLAIDAGHDAACAAAIDTLTETGQFDDAEDAAAVLLEAAPTSARTLAALATSRERRGRPQDAFDLLAPLIEQGSAATPVLLAFARIGARLNPPSSRAIAPLVTHLGEASLPAADRAIIYKALADLSDALGRFDEALHYLKAARGLQAVDMRVVRQRIEFTEEARRHYTQARLDALPRAATTTDLPIFVVGMPRSGTTLTEQILSAHPAVHGAGELTQIGRAVVGGFGTGLTLPACLDELDQQRVDALGAEIADTLRALNPQARRIVDKMPLNFLHLGAIDLLLPRARVVHCTRHPLDTCISILFNDFTDALAWTRRQDTLGAYYRAYAALMRHWQDTVRLPVFELNYERLVADPENTIRSLLDFCGLDWDDACLDFSRNRRQVDTPSYHQVRQPLYTRSVGRYRHYADGLGELIDALGDELDAWPGPEVRPE